VYELSGAVKERAQQEKNQHLIIDPCPPSFLRMATGGKVCRVYVGNLSWNISPQQLKDHMQQVGNVIHVDVFEDRDGRSKGCGVVEFETPEEARRAIEELTDTQLNSRQIFVREDREDGFTPGRPRGGDRGVDRGAYAGAGYGRGRGGGGGGGMRGRGRGGYFGGRYGNFGGEYYEEFREDTRPMIPRGGGMMGSNARAVPNDIKGRQVFIGNLAWRTSWQDLKDAFRPFGHVLRAEVYTDENGDSKGCGTVLFEDPEAAEKAIIEYNDKPLQGRNISVRIDDGPPQGRRRM